MKIEENKNITDPNVIPMGRGSSEITLYNLGIDKRVVALFPNDEDQYRSFLSGITVAHAGRRDLFSIPGLEGKFRSNLTTMAKVYFSGVECIKYSLNFADPSIISKQKDTPPILLNLKYKYNQEVGVQPPYLLISELENVLEISRSRYTYIELFCDFSGRDLSLEPRHKFRVPTGTRHIETLTPKGSSASTLYFGNRSSKMSASLYNKSEECRISHKESYLEGLQIRKGQSLFRLEFKLKWKVLKLLGILTLDDLEPNLPALWAYCTRWLIHTDDGKNPSDDWLKIQNFFGEGHAPLVRAKIDTSINAEYQTKSTITGLAKTGALVNLNEIKSIAAFCENFCSEFNIDFAEKVEKEAIRLADERQSNV